MSKLLEAPDFDDMEKLITEIGAISIETSLLSLDIKNTEAKVMKEAYLNKDFFIDGKRPSITYLTNTIKQLGINNELVEPRKKLVALSVLLEQKQNILNMYKSIIDVWRTQNANQRKGAW